MTELQNSAFKEKASRVEDVSKILPEVGAVVLNNLDGRLYAADQFGWHRFGDPYSPITLFVDFNGVDQFEFDFKVPATDSLIIHDGDGTVTEVAGNDDTYVTHTTNYATAGIYIFAVVGDYPEITALRFGGNAKFDIAGTGPCTGLVSLELSGSATYGDISVLGDKLSLEYITLYGTDIWGDMDSLKALPALIYVFVYSTSVSGDISNIKVADGTGRIVCFDTNVHGNLANFSDVQFSAFQCYRTKATFDTVALWDMTGNMFLDDNNFTPTMVDNALQSFVNLTGCTIRLGGNNKPRTSASDAAFAIVDAANTLTVNS